MYMGINNHIASIGRSISLVKYADAYAILSTYDPNKGTARYILQAMSCHIYFDPFPGY